MLIEIKKRCWKIVKKLLEKLRTSNLLTGLNAGQDSLGSGSDVEDCGFQSLNSAFLLSGFQILQFQVFWTPL